MAENNNKIVTEEQQKNFFFVVLLTICLCLFVIAVSLVRFILIDNILAFVGEYDLISLIAISMGFLFLINSYMFFFYQYSKQYNIALKEAVAFSVIIALVYTLCLYSSLISIYIIPIYLAAFIVGQISGKRQAYLINVFTVILVFYALSIVSAVTRQSLIPTIAMCVTGLVSGSIITAVIAGDYKRYTYFIKGFIIGIGSILVMTIMSFILPDKVDMFANLMFMGISMVAQLMLGIIIAPFAEHVFNLVTNSRLMELTDHRSPLMSRLRREAPGTFSHSMSVASFAEMCALAIGENPYLARACAYYHDVGKLANPEYFKENQSELNLHDQLLPEVSADIIRSHTTEGYKICNEYHIPAEVAAVTREHHGTMIIPVFFNKAKKLTDGEVNIDEYRYIGPLPHSKMTAIIMLSDSSEAAIRAMDAPNGEKVDKLLSNLINERLAFGQFDECNITMSELNTIKETIIKAYGGVFHKRIVYPEGI